MTDFYQYRNRRSPSTPALPKRLARAAIRIINWTFYKTTAIPASIKTALKAALRKCLPKTTYESITKLSWKLRRHYLPPKPGPRWYIKPQYDIPTFFSRLNQCNINYVILRWFEALPELPEGEDIDILVDDDQINIVRSFCDQYNNGSQPLDIYSVSGQAGSLYSGTPYYPAKLAQRLLNSKRQHNHIYYVPDDKHHFLSLAYHALFHKGSLNPSQRHAKEERPQATEHDYHKILKTLADNINIQINELSPENLYKFLESKGWTPELDTLRLHSRSNPWLFSYIHRHGTAPDMGKGELVVFIIRDWAAKNNKIDLIISYLESRNLAILNILTLGDTVNLENAKRKIRGGEWGRGPYPASGGDPHTLVACFDYSPVEPTAKTRQIYPHLSNENILIKHDIREFINRDTFFFRQANCMHSADDETEALRYLEICSPEFRDDILQKVGQIRATSYFHDREVVRSFVPNGTRAKTELIRFQNSLAVQKTFKPGCERFLERESYVYKNFSQLTPVIPELLERGDSHIVVEYHHNILDELSDLERREKIRHFTIDIMTVLKLFYDHSYAIIGFYPGNLIITPRGELKIIDFEFLHRYERTPKSFRYSYDLVGAPKQFRGDMPRGDSNHTLNNTWRGYLDMEAVKTFLLRHS